MPTTNSNGIEIHYEVYGEGIPIVLGHSFLCSTYMWEPQVAPLAENYRVINIDARGHGESGPVTESMTLYDMVDDVIAVMDHLEIEKAVWGGLSIGGMVAMRAVIKYPERVLGMMLLDTDAGPETPFICFKYSAMGLIVKWFGVGAMAGAIAKLMFAPCTLHSKKELVDYWKGQFTSVHVPSILIMLEALKGRDDLLEKLGDIALPTMVLVGEQDQSLPPVRSKRIAEKIEGAAYVEIVDAGHLSTVEQPEDVTKAMLNFMATFKSV